MPPEPTPAAAPEAEAKAPPEEPKPKPEAAPKAKVPDPASALHSRYQKQIADAKKDATAAQRDAASARTEAEEARAYAKVLFEERGEAGEEEQGRLERLAKREVAADAREKRAAQAERLASARLLHAEYGVPEDDLLAFDDPRDMKIAALEWQRDNPKPGDAPPSEEAPKPAAETPTPAEEPPGFDGGGGDLPAKRIADMSDEQFEAYDKAQAAKSRRAAAQGR